MIAPWLVGGSAGAAAGLLAGALLARGSYRRGVEREQPRPAPPAAVAAGAALGIAGSLAAATRPLDAALAPIAVFGVVALAAAWVDLDVRRVPNVLTGGGTVAVLGAAAAAGPWGSAARALAASGVLLAMFGLLALVSSIGGGDVKFAAAAGAALGFDGWHTVLVGVGAGLILAAAAAVVLLLRGRARDSHLPFAPPLAAGALLALVAR